MQIPSVIFAFDDMELDAERYELRRAGKLVRADEVVLHLLAALVRKAPRLVTKEQLVEEVWGGRQVADNVLTVAIARLRKLLDHRRGEREFIGTSYGRGYRFLRPVATRISTERPSGGDGGNGDSMGCVLVGRERVLAALARAVQSACRGRGRLCAVMGEPGIGKTYVIEALERELSNAQLHVVWGFCREAGDTPPLWPWLRIFREIASTAEKLEWTLSHHPVRRELETMLSALDMRDMNEPQLPAVIERMIVRGAGRHQLFDVASRFLRVASEHIPWLLVLEDLHRIDDASLELLNHLLDEIGHMRILVVVTARTSDARALSRVPSRLPQVLGHRNGERIVLERLGPDEVARYVGTVLGDPDGALASVVYEKSEGNPFFMAELTRQLLAHGREDPAGVALPDASLDLLRQHLSQLDPSTREVLSAAAVIGRSFELPLLRAITQREARALVACVDEAIAAGVVIAAPDSKTGFAFAHELQRTVLYEWLSPVERRSWHLRIAAALEARVDTRDAAQPSELAHHYYQAMPETDLRKTVHFCRMAAASAAMATANVEVVRYVRHALEALDMMERPSVRLRMHMLYVAAMFARGYSASEFGKATSELLTLAREHGDGMMLVCGAIMLNLHPGLAPIPGAASALTLALERLPPDKQALRAAALAALAVSSPTSFTERCYPLTAQAVPMARATGSRMARYVTLLTQLYLHGGPAHGDYAGPLLTELEQLGHQHPTLMPMLPVDISLYRAVTALQQADEGSMVAAIDRAAARCREVQHAELLWHCARFRAMRKINAGELAEGAAQLEALHAQAEQRGLYGTAPFCAFDRAVALPEVIGAPELDDRLRSALAYEAADPPSLWSLKLRALSSVGLLEEARSALRAATTPEGLARLPCDAHYLGTLGHLAQVALKLQEHAYAEALYGLLEPYCAYYAGHISFYCEGAVPQLRGMLARRLGHAERAIALLERAVEMNDRAQLPARAAEARLELAECLEERGGEADRARAEALRRDAASHTPWPGELIVARSVGVRVPVRLADRRQSLLS